MQDRLKDLKPGAYADPHLYGLSIWRLAKLLSGPVWARNIMDRVEASIDIRNIK